MGDFRKNINTSKNVFECNSMNETKPLRHMLYKFSVPEK